MPKLAAPSRLSDAALELVAARFRALGDAARLRILRELLGGECAVQELAERAHMPQPSVSKHLAVLRHEGVVARTQRGAQAFYRVRDASVTQLCEIVCQGLATRLAGHLADLTPAARTQARRTPRTRARARGATIGG